MIIRSSSFSYNRNETKLDKWVKETKVKPYIDRINASLYNKSTVDIAYVKNHEEFYNFKITEAENKFQKNKQRMFNYNWLIRHC